MSLSMSRVFIKTYMKTSNLNSRVTSVLTLSELFSVSTSRAIQFVISSGSGQDILQENNRSASLITTAGRMDNYKKRSEPGDACQTFHEKVDVLAVDPHAVTSVPS